MTAYASAAALQGETLKEIQLSRKPLPLVIEILPGQAGEGLIDIYDPGNYEEVSLRELVYKTLSRKNWSIEEKQILDDIHRQLSGGKLLIRGREISGTALEHAFMEETEEGEKYLYISIRAIKPQEGGAAEKLQRTGRCP
ncbi:MAG: hypothetical protein AAGU11_22985 [Syntrophobacteraceae bacterium]